MEDRDSLILQYKFLNNLIKNHERSQEEKYLQMQKKNSIAEHLHSSKFESNCRDYLKKHGIYRSTQCPASVIQHKSYNQSKVNSNLILQYNAAPFVSTLNQNPYSQTAFVTSRSSYKAIKPIPKPPIHTLFKKGINNVKSMELHNCKKLGDVNIHKGKPNSGVYPLPANSNFHAVTMKGKKGLSGDSALQNSDKLQSYRFRIACELKKSQTVIQELSNKLPLKNHEKLPVVAKEMLKQCDEVVLKIAHDEKQDKFKIPEGNFMSPISESPSSNSAKPMGNVLIINKILEQNSVKENKKYCDQDVLKKPRNSHIGSSDSSKNSPLSHKALVKHELKAILNSDSVQKLHSLRKKMEGYKKICCNALPLKKPYIDATPNCLKRGKGPRSVEKIKCQSKSMCKKYNRKTLNSKYIYVAKTGSPKLNNSLYIVKKKDSENCIFKNNCSSHGLNAIVNKPFITSSTEKKKCCKLLKGKYQLVNKSNCDLSTSIMINCPTKKFYLEAKEKSKPRVSVFTQKGNIKHMYDDQKPTAFHRLASIKTSAHKTNKCLFGKYKLSNLTPVKSAHLKKLALQNQWKNKLNSSKYKFVNKRLNHMNDIVRMIKAKYKIVNRRPLVSSDLMKWTSEKQRMRLRKLNFFECEKSENWRNPYNYKISLKHEKNHIKASGKYVPDQYKKLVRIGGTAYKVSKTKVIKASKSTRPTFKFRRVSNACNKNNSLSLRRIHIGNVSYFQTRPGCLKKSPSSQTQNLASRVLNRSIHRAWAASAKKNTKNNRYCMFYNRFGRCNKGDKCTYIHDPSKVAICSRFLRGTCKIEGCPFSHEVSADKMPICTFFLRGICTNNKCPYKHTAIEPGTKLCKAFVRGYCHGGNQCKNAHIFACPQFICEGHCEKESSCMWPHPPVKWRSKRKNDDPSEILKKRKVQNDKSSNCFKDSIEDGDSRYFVHRKTGCTVTKCSDCAIQTNIKSQTINLQENAAAGGILHTRALTKFCVQPEFIPLLYNDDSVH